MCLSKIDNLMFQPRFFHIKMSTLVWIDKQNERHEKWFLETSAMAHFIWKRWPYAMINWGTGKITIANDEIVATII